ncbi:MAG TPA: hypothetical protein VG014_07365 [Acidimicrobiales bacterium]|jgi:hypothetical protein|nr:hypothetical protein [Acidimicrobiales bacterium]
MKFFLALVASYAIGARTGGQELDRMVQSLKALCETDEFADVVDAARSQASSIFRDIAGIVEGHRSMPEIDEDLVARVSHLVGRV